MEVLKVNFRTESEIERLLALHSNTFVMMTSKNYIFGFREIFGGECFVMEIFCYLQNRNANEVSDFLKDLGISLTDFEQAKTDFNSLCGTKVRTAAVSFVHNRMTEKQPSLFESAVL